MKRTTDEEDERRKREKKERKDKEKAQRRKDREEEDDLEEGDAWQVQGKGPQAKPKMFAKDADINTSVVLKKLSEILAARGKKGITILSP